MAYCQRGWLNLSARGFVRADQPRGFARSISMGEDTSRTAELHFSGAIKPGQCVMAGSTKE